MIYLKIYTLIIFLNVRFFFYRALLLKKKYYNKHPK